MVAVDQWIYGSRGDQRLSTLTTSPDVTGGVKRMCSAVAIPSSGYAHIECLELGGLGKELERVGKVNAGERWWMLFEVKRHNPSKLNHNL